MRKGRERGAIVVEATISLSVFIFVIYTLLSVVNIYYVQAKMNTALTIAAKEISQYSYLYYKLGIDGFDETMSDGTEDAKSTATSTIDGVDSLISSLSDAEDGAESGDFDSMISSIESGVDDASSLVSMYQEQIGDDPMQFIIGMGKLAGNEIWEEVKSVVGAAMANMYMQKNLMEFDGDSADAFLKRHNVVDGVEGLDFEYTSILDTESTGDDGQSGMVQLVVTYDVEVIKLLNLDITYTFRHCAQTRAWGNGVFTAAAEDEEEEETEDEGSFWDKLFN